MDGTKEESTEELNTRLKSLMNQSQVVLFMKGSPGAPRCGFSRKISGLLKEHDIEFKHFDILTDESVRQGKYFKVEFWFLSADPTDLKTGLKVLNDWPTFPQLIVNGELVGGLDIVQEMIDNGEFKELLA